MRGDAAAALAALGLALLAEARPAHAATAAQSPARATPAPRPPASDDDADDVEATPTVSGVTVTARRAPPQPGAVVGDIKPELQLGPADIQSYGVSSVTELLNELAPETRSDRGRGGEAPVVLLNGRRISSLTELQNIPTEAILRVDILPEEVALKYGYTANQRVVNIVLRRRFRAVTGEAIAGAATEGGDVNGQTEGDLLRLRGDNRLNLDVKYAGSAGLTEAQRDLASTPLGAPFDLTGNVLGLPAGAEIDPALSALAGRPVTIAGVPAGAGAAPLTLAQFLPTAGAANVTDVAADRSLTPATQKVTANAVLARPIFGGIRATVNVTLSADTSASLEGLPGVGLAVPAGDPFSPFGQAVAVDRYVGAFGPSRQTANGWSAHFGSTLNRDLGSWRLSLTDAYDHSDSRTVSDVGVDPAPLQNALNAASAGFDPFGLLPAALLVRLPPNTARSVSDSGNVQILANGPLLALPAGQLYASLKAGGSISALGSDSRLLGAAQSVRLSRNAVNAQLNLDLPLTSRERHVLGVLGDLSVNLNSAVERLSDFGALPTLGYGLNWTPLAGVTLIVSHTTDHAAPTTAQLGGAVVTTSGVRVFDYATGRTVEVTQVTGGNRALRADTRNVLKIGLTLKPLASQDLTVSANYVESRIANPIATFSAADAAIQAAFPGRFPRDPDGDLAEEDLRPVNYAESERREIRWGINFSRPIGPQPRRTFDARAFAGRGRGAGRRPPDGGQPPPDGAPPPSGAPTGADAPGAAPESGPGGGPPGAAGGDGRAGGLGGGRGGFGRGGFGGAGGPAGGRLQFAIYHTVIFADRILVARGGPLLDLLGGAPAGNTGGQPQQEVEAQAAITLRGFGARLSADWKSGTRVHADGAGAAEDLTFSAIGTINLRLFDDFSQQRWVLRRLPWLRGARLTLNAINLLDTRQRVRDGAGATPLSYQPAYLDPVGRTLSVSFRKLFY